MTTVLISGAGIAGPTLAYWLKAAGFEPTLVELAPAPRVGGYVVDFWGLGYDIAEKMGLAPDLERVGLHMRELRIVDARGERVTGFGTRVFRELTGGKFVTLPRSELSRLLLAKAALSTEVIFGDEIVALGQDDDGVRVRLKHAGERRFDLVVGACGVHSPVRRLTFGPRELFERRLGYVVAAFEGRGYRPRDEGVYLVFNEPGRMIGRLALRDDRTLFLCVFAAHQPVPRDRAEQRAMLRETFGDGRWECRQILAALDRAGDLYFEPVTQIRMPRWSRGRVALVGDAACCVSLLAGQGSALAMVGAYVLAGELAATGGRHGWAFASYEARLRSFMASKQRAAERLGGAFAPRTGWGLALRNLIIAAASIPVMSRYIFGRDLVDNLQLPAY
jgi:2-polyprenyl-6-methoxyphenol hydroxylase-like FAD-dependent oxidoreductase